MSSTRVPAMLAALALAGAAQAQQCPTDDDSNFIFFQPPESTTIVAEEDVKIDIIDHDYDAVKVSVNNGDPLDIPMTRLTDVGPKKDFKLKVGPRKSKAEVIVPEGARLLFVRTYKRNACVSQAKLELVGGNSRVRAVVVGINKYPRMRKLDFAEQDAIDFERLLRKRVPEGDLEVESLIGSAATEDAIEKALFDATRQSSTQGTVLVFFSGHGVLIEDQGTIQAYLVPYDAKQADYPPDFIWHGKMLRELASSRAKNKIVILDSCFSGLSLGDDPPVTADQTYVAKSITQTVTPSLRKLARDQPDWKSIPDTVVWFSGSSATQVSYEAPELGHGVFTHYLLQAGESGATYSATFAQVQRALEDHKKGKQTPALLGNQGSLQTLTFPLTAGDP